MKHYSQTSLSLLGLLLSVALPAFAAKTVDRSVAIVNNEVILESDIAKFQDKLRSKSFQELFGAIDERALKNRDTALTLLIEEKLINQQVKKLELTASDQEVEGQIKAIAKRNGITSAQLTERLKQLGTSITDYKEGIRRQIERKNLVEREIKPSLEISEEQLRHFYTRTSQSNDGEIQYRIAHILIEPKTKNGVSAEQRAKTVAKELAERPENFEAYAKDYSDDTTTSEVGGALGFFGPSQLSAEFRNVVPKTSVGKVTAPIRTKAGFHIVKVLEAKNSDFSTLPKERKDALRNQMMAEELERRMSMWIERKKAEAFIKISSNPEKTGTKANE